MKKLENKLRKLGFDDIDICKMDNFLDFKINKEVRIRVNIISKSFNYFNEGSHKVFLSTWLPFSSIKDLKKQVKEKTGIVIDKPVTKEELKKYGWVDCEKSDKFIDHPNIDENGIFYTLEDQEITASCNEFTTVKTMRELKAYVLKFAGEKMKKVKKAKQNKLPNTLIDQSGNGNDFVKKPIELPKRWEDIISFCGDNGVERFEYIDGNSNIITHYSIQKTGSSNKSTLPKGLGKPMLATCQLLLLRDIYRKDWKPDWSDSNQDKFCILRGDNTLTTTNSHYYSEIFAFQDTETRNAFLNNFKPLLEEHYKLYN